MIVILLALVCGADASLNDKVVQFARSKVGEKVGDGQCSSLAAQALRYAGARVRRGEHGSWGNELKSLSDAKPGDIIQLENVLFSYTGFSDDGGTITQEHQFGHHTAVIVRVRKRGTKPIFVVLHQNVNDVQIVQEWTMNLAHQRRGSVKVYRPVAK